MVQEERPFSIKGISSLELWQPFCTAERNHLCNFGRGYYNEPFLEIILNLGQWRCRLKDFLSGRLAALLFLCSGAIYAKKFTDGCTHDGRRPMTTAHIEPSAQAS